MGTTRVNEYGQPIGEPLPDWTPPPPPPRVRLVGRYCELRPLEPSTADGLWEAFSLDPDAREWTYLPYGPFPDREAFRQWVGELCRSQTQAPRESWSSRPPGQMSKRTVTRRQFPGFQADQSSIETASPRSAISFL